MKLRNDFLERSIIPAEGRLSEDPGGGENQRVRPPSVRRVWAKRRHLGRVWGVSRNENGWGWGLPGAVYPRQHDLLRLWRFRLCARSIRRVVSNRPNSNSICLQTLTQSAHGLEPSSAKAGQAPAGNSSKNSFSELRSPILIPWAF